MLRCPEEIVWNLYRLGAGNERAKIVENMQFETEFEFSLVGADIILNAQRLVTPLCLHSNALIRD